MGVYDHMARPSMGHKLQVELRDSMEQYHSDKEYLQTHLAKLRFRSKDLHTSPQPLTPEVPVKKWGEPGSRFSQAPDVAAQKARLAQLQQESSGNVSAHPTHTGSKSTFLPPISAKATTEDQAKPEATGTEECPPRADKPPASKSPASKAGAGGKATGPGVQTKKVSGFKGRKLQKKAVVKKGAVARDRMLPVLKLPTIYSATPRSSMWDSGKQHLLVQGPSTHLEKNQVDEECRNFNQRSVTIPAIVDSKRTEIQRPLGGTWNKAAASTKVQFRRHPPHPHHQEAAANADVADPTLPPKPSVDHFPRNTPRLPELDDASTDDGQSEDGTADSQEPGQRPLLPPIPASTSLQQSSGPPVPPLHLPPGMTSSAMSTATARTGATAATYMSLMSQETQEWKGAYMTTDDPHYKSRMLMEILHATRQRMQDNAEDMRLAGDLPHPADSWGMEGHSEVMLLHRDSAMASEATTARSSAHQHKPFKLPHSIKKRAGGRPENQNSKLHRYLNKLSHQRSKGGGREQPQPQQRHAPFQLATMTIREITQSSIEHGALQTAS